MGRKEPFPVSGFSKEGKFEFITVDVKVLAGNSAGEKLYNSEKKKVVLNLKRGACINCALDVSVKGANSLILCNSQKNIVLSGSVDLMMI